MTWRELRRDIDARVPPDAEIGIIDIDCRPEVLLERMDSLFFGTVESRHNITNAIVVGGIE